MVSCLLRCISFQFPRYSFCHHSSILATVSRSLSRNVAVWKYSLRLKDWRASRLLVIVTGVVGVIEADRKGKKRELLADVIGGGAPPEEELRVVRAAIRDSSWSFIVEWVQQYGADVVISPSGQTALAFAAEHGSLHIVRSLLSYGANPHEGKDKNGLSALMCAARNGHYRVVQALLESGVQPDSDMEIYGNAAIHMAVGFGHVGTTRVLLSARSNPNLRQGNLRAPKEYMAETVHETPMHLACRPKPPHVEVMRRPLVLTLLHFGANPCNQDDNGDTPVHTLARQEDVSTLWSLLSHCPPDWAHAAVYLVTNSRGATPLEDAPSLAVKSVLHLAPQAALLRQHLGWGLTDDSMNDRIDGRTEEAAWKVYQTRLQDANVQNEFK